MTRARKFICISGAALAVAAVPSLAAEPTSGEVSTAKPKVEWTGQSVNGGATTIPAVANGGAPACVPPSCDTFALTVKDSADLTVFAEAPDTGGFLMIQIVKPDGETLYNGGAEDETSNKVKIKKAPTGEYEVQIAANSLTDVTYTAYAELSVPPAAVTPPAPSEPAPAPAAPAPATEPGANLSLRTRSVSAKRSKKAPKLVIASDREVTDVVVSIKKGSKVLGTGKLPILAGSKTVKVKLKKALRRGKYTVALVAKQNSRTVGATAKLTVKR